MEALYNIDFDVYMFAIFAILIISMLFSILKTTRTKSLKEQHKEEERLQASISAKVAQLNQLDVELENKSTNKDVNLSNLEVKVLDLYEESHIQIPVDIIEELSHMRLQDEKEIFDYIENQRNYWKLENTKKTFRKVK